MAKGMVSADWHIKLGVKNIPDAWALNRFNILFDQLLDLEKEVDFHVIAGDIFDKYPKLDEIGLFESYLTRVTIPTYIISGNHEALKKSTTFLSYRKNIWKILNSNVHLIDTFDTIDNMDFIPYNKLKEYHPADIDFHSNILFTHVRGEIPPHVKPEVPLELFKRWEVVFAGDLHSHSNSQLNIVYPGSPVTTSFHRSLVDTGVVLFDTRAPKDYEFRVLDVPQLIKKTVQAGEPMPETDYHRTIYDVEGDMSQLGAVTNSELLDKKIVKRTSEAALVLTPEMDIGTELREYLLYIQELDENTTDRIMNVYHDNIKET